MVKIISCSCKHDMQDQMYGSGKRLANKALKTGKWRCTVCAKEHS